MSNDGSSEDVDDSDNVDDDDSDDELSEILLTAVNVRDFAPGEYGLVGVSLGGGFENTAELKPMKYEEAMAGPDNLTLP